MWKHLIWVIAFWTTIDADCGHCPTKNITNKEDRLQAQAYNAMPKNWKPVSMNSVEALGFGQVPQGYGQWKCTTPCATETGSGGYTMCVYYPNNMKTSKPKRTYNYCARKYHDDGNRKCIDTPKWDESKQKMWCKTHYAGSVWNWSYTHFPICASTKQMCIYQDTAVTS